MRVTLITAAVIACVLLPEARSFWTSSGLMGLKGSSLSCARLVSRTNRRGAVGLKASVEDLLSPLGDFGKKVGKSIDWFFDTSEVSGAKAWRLQQIPGEADALKWRSQGDDLEDMMMEQVKSKREKAGALRQGDKVVVEGSGLSDKDFFDGDATYSMTDEDLSDALAQRLAQISDGISKPTVGVEGLTGMELAEMCVAKYGVAYDMSIKCDKFELVSDRKLVSLNLYYAFYGQLNPAFPYSEEQYIARLGAMASLINQWGQAEYVRDFFRETPTAYRGLPSRPRWDTAVSCRLSSSPTWNPDLADDFFRQ